MIANVTIDAEADTGAYDVAVTTSKGRKGVGIEMFTVADVFPTIVTFRDTPTDNIRSDAELRSDPLYHGPDYEDAVCAVVADLGSFSDARLDPDAGPKKRFQKDCGEARALIFEWDDPDDGGAPKATRIDGIFSNIDHVLTVAPNATEYRMGQFNLCGRLIFNPLDPAAPNNGSDLLRVTFNAGVAADPWDDEWVVETQAYPEDKGYCQGDGRLWHMPFRMTIRRKPPS